MLTGPARVGPAAESLVQKSGHLGPASHIPLRGAAPAFAWVMPPHLPLPHELSPPQHHLS